MQKNAIDRFCFLKKSARRNEPMWAVSQKTKSIQNNKQNSHWVLVHSV